MMTHRAVIPFRIENPKSRLSAVLSPDARVSLVRLMLKNTVSVLGRAGISSVDILSVTPIDLSFLSDDRSPSLSVQVDDRDLNGALNDYLKKCAEPVLIIMADLPLVTPDAVRRVCSSPADICIAPGRGGGTNLLKIARPEVFRVRYYGKSFVSHRREAASCGLSFDVADSFFAGADLDEPDDIVEVLIHGDGPVFDYLSGLFDVDDTNACLRARVAQKK